MSENNRIGEACWYNSGTPGHWRRGFLRMWFVDADSEAMAVVEDRGSLRPIRVPVEVLSFSAPDIHPKGATR